VLYKRGLSVQTSPAVANVNANHHHHHFIRQNYTYIKHVKEYSWQDIPGSKSAYSSLK